MTPARMISPAIPLLVAAAFVMTTAAPAQDTAQWNGVSAQSKRAKKKPADKSKSGSNAQAAINPNEPTLLGQYVDWGAYVAVPGGKKVCFALSKPKSMKASKDDVKRDQAYMFIATRPSEKVKDEISVIIGYPLKKDVDASAQVGSKSFAMQTQNDNIWIKNAAEEPQLVEAMRKGADMTVKATSTRGTHTTDIYSLMGVSNALDRVAKECGGSG